ncbi:MAG: hypothetical protein NTZ60_01680 [Campylobacterales bacterium]|nr:hypothetical protein [Campylobacterales bacterium]
MHSIRLDINDNIFEKVMFFLNNIPSSDLKIKIESAQEKFKQTDSLVSFFQNSPLCGEIELLREKEVYEDRVQF